MSKTRRGSKGPGYEYWSGRPFHMDPPGKFSKRRTHKAERQQAEADIQLGLSDRELQQDERAQAEPNDW